MALSWRSARARVTWLAALTALAAFALGTGVARPSTAPAAAPTGPAPASLADNVFTTLDTSTGAGSSIIDTVGSDGLPVIAYLAGPLGPGEFGPVPVDPRTLKLAHCSNSSCTSATIVTLAADAGEATGWNAFGHSAIGLAVGVDGLPLVTYYKYDTKDLVALHCGDVRCKAHTVSAVDTAGDVGRDSSVTIAPAIPDAGSVHPTIPAGPVIAYFDATNLALKVARCADAACTGDKTILTLDTGLASTGAATSIATSVNGTPIIAYRVGTIGVDLALKTAFCETQPWATDWSFCGAPLISTVVNLGAAATAGTGYTSMVIGSDGLPLIAWEGLVHCNDVACRTASTAGFPDDPARGWVPMGTSLAVGADHLPMFTGPFPAGPGRSSVGHCTTVTCSDVVISWVAPGVWRMPSVTIGTDGLPFIAYTSGMNLPVEQSWFLNVVHCANEFCSSQFHRR